MKIGDILEGKGGVVTIGPGATLREALRTFVERKVGALPVQDAAGMIRGIITERDLMREIYRGGSLDSVRVEEAMTRNLITAGPEDDIERVMNEMTERRFRHMPVVSGGKMVGIVSIGDLVKGQLRHAKVQITHLMDYVSGPISG
jgi:CBS domain-containing protein